MTTKLNSLAVFVLLIATLLGGCTTKTGKVEPAVKGNQGASIPGSILIIGNVPRSVVPWHDGLTMSRALQQAGYQISGRKVQIGVVRKGQEPLFIDTVQLQNGQDVLLESGDRIEIER